MMYLFNFTVFFYFERLVISGDALLFVQHYNFIILLFDKCYKECYNLSSFEIHYMHYTVRIKYTVAICCLAFLNKHWIPQKFYMGASLGIRWIFLTAGLTQNFLSIKNIAINTVCPSSHISSNRNRHTFWNRLTFLNKHLMPTLKKFEKNFLVEILWKFLTAVYLVYFRPCLARGHVATAYKTRYSSR